MESPCTHCTGQNFELGNVDTVYVGQKRHVFDRDAEGDRWRWLCSCGGRGQWQYQSPNVAYHSWLQHVVKAG